MTFQLKYGIAIFLSVSVVAVFAVLIVLATIGAIQNTLDLQHALEEYRGRT